MKNNLLIMLSLFTFVSVSSWSTTPEIEQLLQYKKNLTAETIQLESDRFFNAHELNLLNELYSKQTPAYLRVLNETENTVKLLGKKVLSINEEMRILEDLAKTSLVIDQVTHFYLPLEKSGKYRRLLNEKDQAYDKFKNSFKLLLKRTYSNLTIKVLAKSAAVAEKYEHAQNAEELISIIKNSSLFEAQTPKKMGVRMDIRVHTFVDGLIKAGRGTFYGLSKFFGNIVGRFESRKGYLWEDKKLEESLATSLEPLDVLLEKTPFRATDRFIPGHWGHAAIYVGNKAQLTELGLWNHPAVVPHHTAIENGATIVEALRPGVQINSIAHFLNIDDLAVQRYNRSLAVAEKHDYLIRTFKQIGKRYDFAFDAESGKTIVCSELPYMIFKDVDFTVAKALGRPNVTPDHISAKSLGLGADFSLILFIHDGKIISEKPEELLATLLK